MSARPWRRRMGLDLASVLEYTEPEHTTNKEDDMDHRDTDIGGKRPVVRGTVNGNAFAVMCAAKKALKKAGQSDKVAEYMAKATAGDYDNFLAVSMEYADFDL